MYSNANNSHTYIYITRVKDNHKIRVKDNHKIRVKDNHKNKSEG